MPENPNQMKLLNKTSNGQLSYCNCCNVYQLEFGNLLFSFKGEEFIVFQNYIAGMDGKKYERKNKYTAFNRKILLSLSVKNTFFMLNLHELEELKILLFIRENCSYDCTEKLTETVLSLN